MKVSNIQMSANSGVAELSADIDGFRLWYRYPEEYQAAVPGDVFLSATLLIAMRKNEPLELDAPCSGKLLAATRGILQNIFSMWYPELNRVPVRAQIADRCAVKPGVISFFSGGVDGLHTLIRRKDEITHLVSVQGIDVQVENDRLWQEALRANKEMADLFGKKLVPIQTNIRHWSHPRGVNWKRFHGAGLASLAHLLGMQRCYIASSHTYSDLMPLGSHPVSDLHWSSDNVELIHDGVESTRSDKLRMISAYPEALERLRVCWMDAAYNCGECEKCMRTRIALRALGLATTTLPRLDSLAALKKMTIWDESKMAFLDDNYRLAIAAGDHELASALRSCQRSYHIRHALAELDEYLLGNVIRKFKRILS